MTQKQRYLKRIKKGIIWLNKETPQWFRKINISQLYMGDSYTCVCGQIFGDYWNITPSKLVYDKTLAYGFALKSKNDDYNILNKIWIRQIEKLRKKYYENKKRNNIKSLSR